MKKNYLVQGLITAGLFVLLLIFSFSGKSGVSGDPVDMNLAQNEAQRKEAFNQIMQNHEVMNDFMNQMWQNRQAMQWMMQDSTFMNHMFSGGNFSYMMNNNPSLMYPMMQHMAGIIDNNQTYMQHWNSMMQHYGHMGGMMGR